jgi:preprotein translocase subunit SecY
MVFVDPDNPRPHDALMAELYPPEASSPPLVFVTLVAGAILVRLLAEVVSRRGLAHGYVVFFTGELLLWTMRKIIDENLGLDMLKLSACILAGIAPILFIVAQLQSTRGAIEPDKPKDEPFEDGNNNNPYAPPNESGSSERSNPTSP